MTESAISTQVPSKEIITVKKHILKCGVFQVHALSFWPASQAPWQKAMAIFAHGYTSHKGSLLTWPTKLAYEGMPSMIFDLPGHYLGSFNEVERLSDFTASAHLLFSAGAEEMKNEAVNQNPAFARALTGPDFKLILGGHSLGALLSIKAMAQNDFQETDTRGILVGFGHSASMKGGHLFETPFYKSTLHLRNQLVSPALNSNDVFAWIKEEKTRLAVSQKKLRLHVITGQDDLVVGADGSENLQKLYMENGHQVTLEKPTSLPHHLPEQAASFVKRYLVQEKIILK